MLASVLLVPSIEHAAPLLPNPKIRHIFHLHAHKAGGTSLNRWVKLVAQEHNLTTNYLEGWPMPRNFVKQPDTLYVTSLRDPVSRIQSSYVYEGRWNLRDGNRTATNGLPFDEFVDRHRCHTWSGECPSGPGYVGHVQNGVGTCHLKGERPYACSANCFAKWLSGIPDDPTCKSNGT